MCKRTWSCTLGQGHCIVLSVTPQPHSERGGRAQGNWEPRAWPQQVPRTVGVDDLMLTVQVLGKGLPAPLPFALLPITCSLPAHQHAGPVLRRASHLMNFFSVAVSEFLAIFEQETCLFILGWVARITYLVLPPPSQSHDPPQGTRSALSYLASRVPELPLATPTPLPLTPAPHPCPF